MLLNIFFLITFHYDTVAVIVGVDDLASSGEYDFCHVVISTIAVFRRAVIKENTNQRVIRTDKKVYNENRKTSNR